MKISDVTQIMSDNYTKRRKKEKSIERLKKQLHKLEGVNWINVVLKPIAQELSSLLKLPVWEILGPFGLCNEITIYFAKNEDEINNVEKSKCIAFRPNNNGDNFRLHVVDYSKNNRHFAENTIGAANGMNFADVDVTDECVKSLIKWVL